MKRFFFIILAFPMVFFLKELKTFLVWTYRYVSQYYSMTRLSGRLKIIGPNITNDSQGSRRFTIYNKIGRKIFEIVNVNNASQKILSLPQVEYIVYCLSDMKSGKIKLINLKYWDIIKRRYI